MNTLSNIIFQAKFWITLASILPLTALAGFYFIQTIGWITDLEKVLSVGAIAMFAIASAWWWWAVYTIIAFARVLNNTDSNLQEIKTNIKSIRQDLQ